MKLPSFFKPNKEFVTRVRRSFVLAFERKFPESVLQERPVFPMYVKGFVIGIAFMAIVSGSAVYADETNVGAENILYPLKRSYENVKFSLASQEDKPAVQANLATRRLEEIRTIEAKDPTNGKIKSLTDDLNVAFKNSLELLDDDEDEMDDAVVSNDMFTSGGRSAKLASTSFNSEKNENEEDEETESRFEGKSEDRVSDFSASAPKVRQPESVKKKSSRDKSLCESWSALVESDAHEAKQVIDKYEGFLRRFERKCLND